jgi:NTE family protein
MINPFKYLRNRKVGLALGSGGAKGISHISVIEYLESLDIPIHMITGSSAGAVVGAVYCCGTLKEFKEALLQLEWNDMISLFDPVFPRSGLIEGAKALEFMKQFIPDTVTIDELPIPLGIIATDLYSGMPITFRSGNLLKAIRASGSIPGIFVPVTCQNMVLIDGGVSKPLPIDVVKNMGAGYTIAVNLHPTVRTRRIKKLIRTLSKQDPVEEKHIRFEIAKSLSNITHHELFSTIADKKWFRSVEKWLGRETPKTEKLPNIFEIISQSVDIMEYTNTMLMLKYQKPTVLIQPDLLDINTLDFFRASDALTEGFQACEKVRGKIIRKIKYWI